MGRQEQVAMMPQETIDKAEAYLRDHPEGVSVEDLLTYLGYHRKNLSPLIPLTHALPIFDEAHGRNTYIFLGGLR